MSLIKIMIHWKALTAFAEVKDLIDLSYQKPCVIFKHSTRCSVSSVAKYRLESDWSFVADEVAPYFLDVISQRAISSEVAKAFEIYHESPQLLLIRNGECVYDASHLDISVQDLRESFQPAL